MSWFHYQWERCACGAPMWFSRCTNPLCHASAERDIA